MCVFSCAPHASIPLCMPASIICVFVSVCEWASSNPAFMHCWYSDMLYKWSGEDKDSCIREQQENMSCRENWSLWRPYTRLATCNQVDFKPCQFWSIWTWDIISLYLHFSTHRLTYQVKVFQSLKIWNLWEDIFYQIENLLDLDRIDREDFDDHNVGIIS